VQIKDRSKIRRIYNHPFPRTYLKSSLGVGLSDSELISRAAALERWTGEVLFRCRREGWDPAIQRAVVHFLAPPHPPQSRDAQSRDTEEDMPRLSRASLEQHHSSLLQRPPPPAPRTRGSALSLDPTGDRPAAKSTSSTTSSSQRSTIFARGLFSFCGLVPEDEDADLGAPDMSSSGRGSGSGSGGGSGSSSGGPSGLGSSSSGLGANSLLRAGDEMVVIFEGRLARLEPSHEQSGLPRLRRHTQWRPGFFRLAWRNAEKAEALLLRYADRPPNSGPGGAYPPPPGADERPRQVLALRCVATLEEVAAEALRAEAEAGCPDSGAVFDVVPVAGAAGTPWGRGNESGGLRLCAATVQSRQEWMMVTYSTLIRQASSGNHDDAELVKSLVDASKEWEASRLAADDDEEEEEEADDAGERIAGTCDGPTPAEVASAAAAAAAAAAAPKAQPSEPPGLVLAAVRL